MESESGKIKSLQIGRSHYGSILKQDLLHQNYFDSFFSTQKVEITDDGPEGNDIGLSTSSLNFTVPYPISMPIAKQVLTDPCYELVSKRRAYLQKLPNLKRKYSKDKHWLTITNVKKKDKIYMLQPYFTDLATGITADADPYFDSRYDYYYAGGNLCKITDQDETFVVYPDNEGKLCFTNKNSPNTTLSLKAQYNTIYNLKTSRNFLTIRQKYSINLFTVAFQNDHKEIKSEEVWGITSPVPITDCDLLERKEISYTDANLYLRIYDVLTDEIKCEHKYSDNTSSNRLMQIKYLNENNLSVMGADYLSVFDTRSSDCNTYKKEETFFSCDDYCAFCPSLIDQQQLLVASRHNLFKFDLRQMKVVRKWTHFMTLDPTVVKSAKLHNEELLCVSGFVDTVCMPVGTGNYVPFRLKTANMGFEKCILQKKFLIPGDSLVQRINMATAGIEFSEDDLTNSDSAIFTCNSMGDVYQHNVTYQSSKEDEGMDRFVAWTDSVPAVQEPLYETSNKDMSAAKKLFKTSQKSIKLRRYSQASRIPEHLRSCLDQWKEHNFSSIWSTDAASVNINGVLSSVTPQHKVSNWLDTISCDNLHEED